MVITKTATQLKEERKGGMTKIEYTFTLEERLAAAFAHYTPEQYADLTGDPIWCEVGEDSKAMVIATFRAQQRMGGLTWR